MKSMNSPFFSGTVDNDLIINSLSSDSGRDVN